jgi:hypothetical protein
MFVIASIFSKLLKTWESTVSPPSDDGKVAAMFKSAMQLRRMGGVEAELSEFLKSSSEGTE